MASAQQNEGLGTAALADAVALGVAPSEAVGLAHVALVQAAAMAMQNAVSQQQAYQLLSRAQSSSACASVLEAARAQTAVAPADGEAELDVYALERDVAGRDLAGSGEAGVAVYGGVPVDGDYADPDPGAAPGAGARQGRGSAAGGMPVT